MQPEESGDCQPVIVAAEFCLIILPPLFHRFLIGRVVRRPHAQIKRKRRKRDGTPRDHSEHGYFFSSAPASFSDFGSDRFLGEAFCSAFTMRRPALGVATLCPITTSRAEIFRP